MVPRKSSAFFDERDEKEGRFLNDALGLPEHEIQALQETNQSAAYQIKDANRLGENQNRALAIMQARDQRVQELLGAEKFRIYQVFKKVISKDLEEKIKADFRFEIEHD